MTRWLGILYHTVMGTGMSKNGIVWVRVWVWGTGMGVGVVVGGRL